jgi:channel protein (hemolysin III family)
VEAFIIMIDIYSVPGFTQPFSSIIFFLGAIFFSYLAYFLIRRGKGSGIRIVSLAIFSSSCVLLLLISAVYHLLETSGTAHMVFQRLDHAAIFLVIAGTFTPIQCILFTGLQRWGFLIILWVLAISGLVIKTVFFETIPEWFKPLRKCVDKSYSKASAWRPISQLSQSEQCANRLGDVFFAA